MNKHIKRLLVTATASLALVGAGGLTAYANGYIQWAGSSDFSSLMNNLNTIQSEYQSMKEKAEGSQTSKDQLKQAEQDMKDAKKKSDEVLEGM